MTEVNNNLEQNQEEIYNEFVSKINNSQSVAYLDILRMIIKLIKLDSNYLDSLLKKLNNKINDLEVKKEVEVLTKASAKENNNTLENNK
ncbi:hypothetical protein AM202_00070 [Actinobacillus minor 202]|uniref:Uncharacterized protein n=1 Tax=Actinobacillus minor 202 TaxID=591023 RepID=A0ABP2GRL0_9PAST|nr:hypothetical protein [Actinobacillus minor]EEV24574.1 hypothetical protein AM202_00070 [Actinobacillus minor 202]